MSRPSGPGKTAPKIFNDVLVFDPLNGEPNILAEHPPPLHDHGGRRFATNLSSCAHEYKTKFEQSVIPKLDERPDASSKYILAATCKRCRIHLDVTISYVGAQEPCPSTEGPLHHFQRLQELDIRGQDQLRFSWRCSVASCSALLHVAYRRPRLSTEEVALLTNPELLKQRYDYMVHTEPNREGVRQATPMEALTRLRRYVKDALNPEHSRRAFPANNKRFMEAFGWYGNDCRALLERFHFGFLEAEGEGMPPQWLLPSPPAVQDRAQADGFSLREQLEDLETELLGLMYVLASDTGAVNHAGSEAWTSANRDIERTLQAQGFQRYNTLRRFSISNDERQYFASLGALELFHDDLVEFAYDRQTACDPVNSPYYFECLQAITDTRQTEQLQMKVSLLASQGQISRKDIDSAYRILGVASFERDIPDAQIIERLNARLSDIGPTGAQEARQALHTIGTVRHSEVLIKASQQTLETYDEALSWLGNGADKNTNDEGLLTVYGIRTGDNPENVEIGRKAISIIASERKSEMLNNWLLTGRSDGYPMGVDEALRHLGIDTSLDSVDQTILPVVFDNARFDRPGDVTEKAIAAVQKALAEPGSYGGRAPETWPVGLVSHGNTCYLNSLLQYYFSIKEFRNIVLDYDRYKLDLAPFEQDPTRKKQQRVGGLQRSLEVIKGAQYFAHDLKRLFDRMIKEPGSAVRPDTDLVCRAFLKPEDWALLDKKSQEIPAQDISIKTDQAPTESVSSSVTLHASEQVRDKDVTMTDGEMPPTPPESPGQSGQDLKAEPIQTPPLPPRQPPTEKESALALAEKNAREQQDVTEVHDAALDRLRIGMTPQGVDNEGEQIDGLRNLFVIDMTETYVKNGVPGKARPAPTTAVQVNVPQPNEAIDIYSALDGFFDSQPVEENPSLESYKSLRTFPPLFQISIPRAGYDKKTGAFFKSNGCIRLEDELYLDRYSDDSDPEILPIREECWKLRKELNALRAERRELHETATGMDKAATMEQSAQYITKVSSTSEVLREIGLDEIEVDEEVASTLSSQAKAHSQRKTMLDMQISIVGQKLSGRFDSMTKIKYRLAAVFIHRGSQGGGHYWIYIHDFASKLWRSYNDESVEEFKQLEHMFEARGGAGNAAPQHGTPTYAVYVKDELKDQLIEPVCRSPDKPKEAEPQVNADVAMSDEATRTPKEPAQPTTTEEGEQP